MGEVIPIRGNPKTARSPITAVAVGLNRLDGQLTAFDCIAGAMVMMEEIKKCGFDVVPVLDYLATPIDTLPRQ